MAQRLPRQAVPSHYDITLTPDLDRATFGGEVTIPTPFIPMRALNIQGSYVGTPGEMKELLELVRRAKPASIPITKRPLAEAYQCLEELKAGTLVGRAVLTPAG